MAGEIEKWSATDEDSDRIHTIMQSLRRESPVNLSRDDLELIFGLEAEVRVLRSQCQKFFEAHQIREMAREESIKVLAEQLREFGLDPHDAPKTRRSLTWVLNLQPGFKAFLIALGSIVGGVLTTLLSTYLLARIK